MVTGTEETDAAVNDRVDAVYWSNYHRQSGCAEPMVSDAACATALNVLRV